MKILQDLTHAWARACFPESVRRSIRERGMRFLEEALELVQAIGLSRTDAMRLVEYVYARQVGEPRQEVGGTLVTLAVLCTEMQISMGDCWHMELERIINLIPEIREKQERKKLAGVTADTPDAPLRIDENAVLLHYVERLLRDHPMRLVAAMAPYGSSQRPPRLREVLWHLYNTEKLAPHMDISARIPTATTGPAP